MLYDDVYIYIIRLIIDKRRKGTIEQKNGTQEYICF